MLSRVDAITLLSDFGVERAFEIHDAQPGEESRLELVQALVAALDSSRRVFPATRDVGRVGDMAPADKSHMRVLLDSDNDVCVEIWDDDRGAAQRAGIEFCTGVGGGRSSHTRHALLALMVAMEQDNAESPRGRYPPQSA